MHHCTGCVVVIEDSIECGLLLSYDRLATLSTGEPSVCVKCLAQMVIWIFRERPFPGDKDVSASALFQCSRKVNNGSYER